MLYENKKAIIIDDVISTAKTKIDSVNLIRELYGNVEICNLVIALDREEVTTSDKSAIEVFEYVSEVPVLPIVRISDVYEYILEKKIIDDKQNQNFIDYFKKFGTHKLKENLKIS